MNPHKLKLRKPFYDFPLGPVVKTPPATEGVCVCGWCLWGCVCVCVCVRPSTCQWGCVCVRAQLCPTLCNPMDCSPTGSCIHGIFQARILEWVAIFSSRGSSQPRDQTWVSCIPGRFFTTTPREFPGQWGVHRFNARSRRIPHATGKLSPCATATEAREATSMRRSCAATRESSPHTPKPEALSNEEPMQPKINKITKKFHLQQYQKE